MPQFDWQTFVSLAVVALASIALVRRMRRWATSKEHCGNACSGCPSRRESTNFKELPLVSLGKMPASYSASPTATNRDQIQ